MHNTSQPEYSVRGLVSQIIRSNRSSEPDVSLRWRNHRTDPLAVFIDNTKLHNYSTQNAPKGLQIKDRSRHKSLISFDRSYLGCIHKIWKKLPNELVQKGANVGWLKIKKSCTISITKGLKIKKGSKKAIKTPIKMDSPLVDKFSRTKFWINRLNYSLFFMPQNVFRRMHAKCNALAQTSFESTRKHTEFMKNLFFPLGRHRSGRRHGRGHGRVHSTWMHM